MCLACNNEGSLRDLISAIEALRLAALKEQHRIGKPNEREIQRAKILLDSLCNKENEHNCEAALRILQIFHKHIGEITTEIEFERTITST